MVYRWVASAALVFGQTSVPATLAQDVAPWVQAGATGIVGGLLVYLVTTYLPRRDDRVAEEIKQARQDYLKQSEQERALYRDQIERERAASKDRDDKEREECERRHREIVAVLVEVKDISRETKHGLNNFLQVNANERELAKLSGKQPRGDGGS